MPEEKNSSYKWTGSGVNTLYLNFCKAETLPGHSCPQSIYEYIEWVSDLLLHSEKDLQEMAFGVAQLSLHKTNTNVEALQQNQYRFGSTPFNRVNSETARATW